MKAANNLEGIEAVIGLSEALAQRMQGGIRQPWLGLSLSVPQLKVLHILAMSGPHSPGNLADLLQVSPATVTGLCDGLAERGFAWRESIPNDRRSHLVVASPAGKRLIIDLVATHREQWVSVLEAMSQEELGLVAEAFRTLLQAIDRVRPRDR